MSKLFTQDVFIDFLSVFGYYKVREVSINLSVVELIKRWTLKRVSINPSATELIER